MRKVWDDKNRLQQHLKIEAALAQAEGELGIIPIEAAEKIRAVATVEKYTVEEIAAEAAKIKHSFMATINAIQNQAGEAGEFVHYGATTQDIVDTGAMLQLKESYEIILRDIQAIKVSIHNNGRAYPWHAGIANHIWL
jgi:adenylosuccinate lyase